MVKNREAAYETQKRLADQLYEQAVRAGMTREAGVFKHAAMELIDKGNPTFFENISRLKRIPVSIEEFMDSEEFIGSMITIWPSLKEEIRRVNPDIWSGAEPVFEACDGGATSTGKTTIALVTQAYQLYCLTCVNRPQRLWNLSEKITPIIFMFQSVTDRVTNRVLYQPFRELFTNMPYTMRRVRWDKDKESFLSLEGNIQVVPALASLTSMVGQAIVSGILDEVNFMSVVQNSKQVVGARGQGGHYDQAEIAYNNVVRRRKSRFLTKGFSIGCFNIISSVRYKGDFLDRHMEFIRDEKPKYTVALRRTQYEAQPAERYSGETFKLLVGSDNHGTRVLKPREKAGRDYPKSSTVLDVPVEYLTDFKKDPEGALRDVAGLATDVISPFITQRHKIVDAIMRGQKYLKPWVVKNHVELSVDGMPQIVEENLPKDKTTDRFVHVDLSVSGDRCGIAVVKCLGHEAIADENGLVEVLPHFAVEMAITIQPSPESQLDIAEVRKWIITLKEYYGINIRIVSYDGFQSTESIQVLRKSGIRAMHISTEKTAEPYEYLKTTLYRDLLDMEDNELLKVELGGLERDAKTGKIDHAPNLSNDCADAVCGALYSASINRTIRSGTEIENTAGEDKQSRRRAPRRRTRRK